MVYANFADLLIKLGNYPRAFDLAAEAAQRNPDEPRNFFLAGKALVQLGRDDVSVRWFEQAIALNADYPEPHYVLSQVYRRLGREADADACVEVLSGGVGARSEGPPLDARLFLLPLEYPRRLDRRSRVRHVLSLLLVFLTATAAAAGQDPQAQPSTPPSEEQQIEDEFIRSRSENGESHASGARPELGPVVLGNPTTAVVALRVGLYASTFYLHGCARDRIRIAAPPFVDLTNTDGDVNVIDKETGNDITVMTPDR